MATGPRILFANLAVENLDRSVAFFAALGFEFDPRFTDETATAMVVNEQAVVMLLTTEKFRQFTTRPLADPRTHQQCILAVSAASREDVDALTEKALAAGGSPANEPMDMGFMYGRSFHDPDGHLWEAVWMDPAALEQSPSETGAAA